MAPASGEGHGIIVQLDAVLRERGMTAAELSRRTGVTEANLSKLRNGPIAAIWFSTLSSLCRELKCEVGDLLVYDPQD